jgi:lipid II:glycine glycyltransferase (peptidoglycan interpeptide bridge formation enzyme)
MKIKEIQDLSIWNDLIKKLPDPHVLQSSEWAFIKQSYGWEACPIIWENDHGEINAAAMVLERRIRLAGLGPQVKVRYLPRGPIMNWTDQALCESVLGDLEKLAKEPGVAFIKMDPELPVGTGIPGEESEKSDPVGNAFLADIRNRGWRFSQDQIQFRNTFLLDIRPSEDEILAAMKQKTRYNIRLAARKGISVREGTEADLNLLYKMYAETSIRDGFVIRSEEYYHSVWLRFFQADMAKFLIAEVEGEPVAGLVLFHFQRRAWYLYGMSTEEHRNKMPTYLLQWEAIRLAKSLGCEVYDLWGAPDVFDDSDSMWGVFRFKLGLGGEVVRTIGAWDFTARPILYHGYTTLLPKILNIMRRRGKDKTRQNLES